MSRRAPRRTAPAPAPAPALALALVALAGCGGEDRRDGSTGSRGAAGGGDPFAAVERKPRRERDEPRTAPRWEPVARLSGTGAATRPLSIAPDAIQWRVRWSCRSGELRLAARSDAGADGLARARCPRRGEATSVRTGRLAFSVRAGGRWRATVEQQVDTPLHEPPPPAVRAGRARRLATGPFYRLERRGRGTAALHELPGGRLALRFEGFETAASADLFVWVSRHPGPRTSRAALAGRYVEVAPLKATAGDQNYVLPARLTRRDVRSVVIWCEPIRIAYAAAALAG